MRWNIKNNMMYKHEVELDESAFKMMKNLKTLIIEGDYFSKGPKYLPNTLRVFKWEGYPSEYLPQDFHPKKLAIFNSQKSCITSFNDSLKKFLNVKILNFDETNCLTEIPDVSSLLNLEEFSFEDCKNLITIHESVGLLKKLKVLGATGCTKLRRFPPIKLMSLERLDLSLCPNLQSFPEILGKMENIRDLVLEDTPIIELPCSFQNLTHLQRLELHNCGTVSLPSKFFMVPDLVEVFVSGVEGLIFPKQSEGEQRVISTVSSNVEHLSLVRCKLSNDFFSTDLTWFRTVKKFDLAGNNFTILPECIKEYHLLRVLILDYCKYLQEVRGIPPNLKIFSAMRCESLTSTEMLLNQELHEAGSTMFCLPGSRIPDWFEHCRSGQLISFWFRNKFPAIALCLVSAPLSLMLPIDPIVIINGNKSELDYQNRGDDVYWVKPHHTYIFDLQQKFKFKDNLDESLLENEWNHVEIMYKYQNNHSVLIEIGIHVFKQRNRMEDIRFTDPTVEERSYLLDDDLKNIEITNLQGKLF
jgi:hypothetical protein